MAEYIEKQLVEDMLHARADMATGTAAKPVWLCAERMVRLLTCADVVQVVRCKDCKFYDEHYCFANQHGAHDDGFCDEGRNNNG